MSERDKSHEKNMCEWKKREREREGSRGGSRKRLLWNPTSDPKIPKVSKPKLAVSPQPVSEATSSPEAGGWRGTRRRGQQIAVTAAPDPRRDGRFAPPFPRRIG